MQRVPVRIRDFSSSALLTIILLTASLRLYVTSWTLGLEAVLLLTVFGLGLGLALGLSRFGRPAVWGFVIGYSMALFPLVLGGTQYQAVPWLERLVSLAGRLDNALAQLFSGQPVQDSILFVTFMSVIFWVISLLGGYTLTRSGAFIRAVLPAGLVLGIIQYYDMRVGDRVTIIALYSLLCLLLLGRLTYLRRQAVWKGRHVLVPAESSSDLNIAFGVTALALVLLAWATPANGRPAVQARVAWETLTRAWQPAIKKLDRPFASLKNRQTPVLVFYGDTLALGQQAQTGTAPYLRILAPLVGGASRYYWRVRTYDTYADGSWSTGTTYDEPFSPDQSPLPLAENEGLSGKFTFTAPNDNLAQLVTPSRPVWLSRPVHVSFLPAAGGRLDPLTFLADPPVMTGEEYVVHANIYEPTVEQLRSAGQLYPSWVTSHYLQLPADLPPVIASLARQIAAGAGTPYDQATAITDYLRKTITYSTTVGATPPGEDPLVWFLFDSRKGFCNYYATAEAVMLRSLGIPARLAVGFAQGDFLVPDLYVVRLSDSHAWPEVYFPGSGWVEFEPTTGQPPLVRPEGDNSSGVTVINPTPRPSPQHNQASDTPTPAGQTVPPPNSAPASAGLIYLVALLLVVVPLLGGGALIYFLETRRRGSRRPLPEILLAVYEHLAWNPPGWLRRWAYLSRLAAPQRAFVTVYRALGWLGVRASAAQTPAEAAAALVERVPAAAPAVRTLLEECQRSLFSQSHADALRARQAAETIRRLSRRAAIRRRWEAFGGIFKRDARERHASG